MSDLNMIPFHVSDSYVDAVLAYHAVAGGEEKGLNKVLFGWMLPASVFGTTDDTLEKSNEAEACKEQQPLEDSCSKLTQEKAPNEEDDASVDTQSTTESDWDDWDDDWNDTYSLCSSEDDEQSLSGEQVYDDWLSQSTLSSGEYDEDKEGELYFQPTPQDFPRVRFLRLWAEQTVPQETKAKPQEHDFWAGVKHNFDKVKAFADETFEEFRRKVEEGHHKGEEARKTFRETRDSAVNKACQSLPADMVDAVPLSRSRHRKVTKTASRVMIERSCTRDNLAALSQESTDGLPRPSKVWDQHMAPLSSLSPSTGGSVRRLSRGSSLRRSHTHDNLAQFFAEPGDSSSRSSKQRIQNKSADKRSNGQFDKSMYAPKGSAGVQVGTNSSASSRRKSTSKRRRSTRSRSANLGQEQSKPSHRRKKSQQRLTPSAIAKNDFPWY